MVIKPAGRWDWWQIPLDWVKALGPGVPGIVVRANGTFEIHRTHLPLLAQLGHRVPATAEPPLEDVVRGVTLRPWQRRARAWAQPRRGTIIAAQPRMGKTKEALLLHEPGRPKRPLVILAPLDVRQVWLDAVAEVFPELPPPFLLEGRTVDVAAMRAAQVIFGHYDVVAHQHLMSLAPGTLIADEIHLLSNVASQRSKGVRSFAACADRVIGLSGSPLWNKVRGLWSLLSITTPGAWGGSPFDFQQRHCSPQMSEHGWVYGEISNTEEWLARRAELVYSASWEEERPDLPPTVHEFVDVAITEDMAAALDVEAAAISADAYAGAGIVQVGVSDTTIGAIGRYRRVTGAVKISSVVDRIASLAEPVVVWSWHKDIAKEVAKRAARDLGRESFMIHGDMTPAKRLAALAAWRQSPTGVLCATLAVGQVGIDLSHARYALFVEFDWTPAVLYQALMRTFFPGRQMFAIFFRVAHPVEKMLVDNVMTKMGRAAASAMPAAGSRFLTPDEEVVDGDDLLAGLRALVDSSDAEFRTWA